MRLTSSPEALPGSCAKCGSASRDFYVDTDLYYEFHGAVFWCCDCAAEMANLMGFVSVDSVKTLHARIEELETERYNLQRQVDGLEKAVDGLTMARGGRDSLYTTVPPGNLLDSIPSVGVLSQGEGMGIGEGEVTEPSHDEGMAELPDDAASDADGEFHAQYIQAEQKFQ